MFKSFTQWTAVAILSMASIGVAHAVTVNYAGTVNSVTNILGDTTYATSGNFSGFFTYNIPTPNSGGAYTDVVTAASVTFGGNTYDFTTPINSLVEITNTQTSDTFAASIFGALGFIDVIAATDANGQTYPGGSDALPTDFTFDTFSIAAFLFQDTLGDLVMDGTLTTLTTAAVTSAPEPSLLGLFGIGLLGVLLSRRKLVV